MPFLPDAWRLPLHFPSHDINEYRGYKTEEGETFKVLRCSRESGRAERKVKHPNSRVSHWSAEVCFGEDGFVWMKDWTTEQILTQDGSVWKIISHPSSKPSVKIGCIGCWCGE